MKTKDVLGTKNISECTRSHKLIHCLKNRNDLQFLGLPESFSMGERKQDVYYGLK